ncbi:MAG: hypothetical protein A3K19_33680 [Lentisphaerae bacterium RIFOXYB12_FULL_65_16]|nr:MAG: hypothetical protein A3K19_30285 [Lentisphaerae bacterium RIFOXYB12_FULL_65_16]OGV95386.1 MAG: hypothetical protein A3K19_33680 [Lentisphaerae bacterium RIFOXYB12_FULL_65_16]
MLVERDGAERLDFVVETKSGLSADDLRDKERAKTECGKAHFQALAIGEDPPSTSWPGIWTMSRRQLDASQVW